MAHPGHMPQQNEGRKPGNRMEHSPKGDRWPQRLWPWLRAYWLDLALALFFLLAVFLAFEPWGIWERLFDALSSIAEAF